jgi:hypothetical protein
MLRHPLAGCAAAGCRSVLSATLAAGAIAQVAPPGFTATTVLTDVRAPWVRSTRHAPGHGDLIAVGGALELQRPGHPMRRLADLGPGDDVACLAIDEGRGEATFVSWRTGRAVRLDLASERVVATFTAVRNSFDAEPLAGGQLLVAANPLWPAPGAHAGVWLVGLGHVPRLLLQLRGPSGPLLVRGSGDLVVAELGPIVPPPPGAARLLRVTAARLQQAIAGATLGPTDVVEQATGYTGIYDLVEDDLGRLHASDVSGSLVVHTAPGSLVPIGTTVDVGAGRSALQLQFVGGGPAPFLPFQPGALAGTLRVAASDFAADFRVVAVQPARPELSAQPPAVLAGGTCTVAIDHAPATGIAVVLGSWSAMPTEQAVVRMQGLPVWLGLPTSPLFTLATVALDSQGRGAMAFANPGGIALPVHMQTVAFGAHSGWSGGSSNVAHVQLLP